MNSKQLSAQEAYDIVRSKQNNWVAHGSICRDYGSFFGFCMVDPGQQNENDIIVPPVDISVDKDSGKVFSYNYFLKEIMPFFNGVRTLTDVEVYKIKKYAVEPPDKISVK